MPRRKNFAKKPPRKRAGRRRFHKRHPKMDRIQSLTVRAPGVVCPDRTFVKLKYLDVTNQVVGTAGNNYGAIQYTANDAHLAAPIGFSEMSALYRYYRVHACSIKIQGSNMESFPVLSFIVPQNTSYAVSLLHGQQSFQNAFVRSRTLAPKGGQDRFMLKSFISTRKLVGSNAIRFDDSYAALTSASPGNVWYWYFYVLPNDSLDTFTLNNGVRFTTQMTMYVEFYERNILSA